MPTFDGNNLLIILDSGVTSVAVEADLYSRWKDWVKTPGNAKYPLAFRTVGGDPLTATLNAGAYFFLQNQLGWRIRPPEEDITILLLGNLAAEDPSLPIVVPTVGDFTALLLGLQSVTQGVDAIAPAVWSALAENGVPFGDAIRIMASVLAGKVSGAGSGIETFRDLADTKDRVVVTVDAQGNRTLVVRDGA